MEPITITGLNAQQVELLNTMWNLPELEDLMAWKSTLDSHSQQQVDLLMQMVVLAATDQIMGEDTTTAAEYLEQFRL